MSLFITVGTAQLRSLSERMLFKEQQFRKQQRGKLKKAARLLGNATRREIRSSILDRKTGTMLKSIKARVYKDRDEPEAFIAFIGATPRGRAFYWKFHEFGVIPGPTRGGRKHGRLSVLDPTPTALPALERNFGRVKAILAESFSPLGGVV